MHIPGINRRSLLKGAVSSVVVGVFSRAAYAQQKAFWEKRASMPYRLQEIYPAVLNSRLHVAGGFINTEAGFDATAKHVVYDPSTDAWSEKASMPAPRHHPNLIAHRGQLFALGGFEVRDASAAWAMQNQSWIYETETDQWREGIAAPDRHAETVCASIGERIHVVGGRSPAGSANAVYADHTDTDHHLVFDSSSGDWGRAAPALTRRNSAAGTLVDGLLYVAGGRTVDGGNVSDLEVYDAGEDRWRAATSMPQAQGGLAAAALDGKLYAFGGEYFNDGGGVYSECWVYDPQTDQWEASDPMLSPRHGLGGVTINGWIYAVGGALGVGASGTSDILERFRSS